LEEDKIVRYQSFDCIVAGGGAAGLMAAVTAARQGARVAILEHTEKMGTKLLQTGNGKCNFTNRYMDAACFQVNSSFAMNVIRRFDVNSTISFFKSIGLYSKEKNGYMYPHSETAAALRDALVLEAARLGVLCITSFYIDKIKLTDKGFLINDTLAAKKLIFATGLKAAPKTGSDGSALHLIKKLGHPMTAVLPALVPLECDKSLSKICHIMAGVRSYGSVTAYTTDDAVLASDIGEIQYTDYGISGIPVFQISHHVVRQLYEGNAVNVVIDMLPDFHIEELMNYIECNFKKYSDRTIEQFFSGFVNPKLIRGMAAKIGCSSLDKLCHLRHEKVVQLVYALKFCKMAIKGYKSFDRAQVCQGGIDVSYIHTDTMESTLVKGLYFAGEIVDVDGICGGYNLQWAWSSGYVAGCSAAGKESCEKSITCKSDFVQT